MLGDAGSRACGDERCSGGNIERPSVVATRPAGVNKVCALWPDSNRMLAHRSGAASDLVGRLAFRAQRDKEARGLGGRRLAAHHDVERGTCIFLGQALTGEESHHRVMEGGHAVTARRRNAAIISGP